VTAERMIQRYAAFFRGWAQAFGEHRSLGDPAAGMRWLVGDDQVGLILNPGLKRLLYPLFLYRSELAAPTAMLRPDGLVIDTTLIPLVGAAPTPSIWCSGAWA